MWSMVFEHTFPDEYPSLKAYTKGVKRAEREIVGRDAEMEQVLAAMMRPELCNVILLAEAGSGKAHANGTLVPVADARGYVPIEDLVPGDRVFGQDGVPVPVLGVYPQGALPAYEVVFQDGSRLICNDEHIFSVRTAVERYHGRDYQNRTLREMMDMDTGTRRPVWYVPNNGAVQRKGTRVPIPGYLAGLLLSACGSYDPMGNLFILRVVRKGLAKRLNGYLSGISYDVIQTKSAVYYLFSDLLPMDSDSWFSMAFQKQIPECYLYADADVRRDVLYGLMDAGGMPGLPRQYDVMLEFGSDEMADSVKELGDSLGIRSVRMDSYLCPRLVFLVSDEDKADLFTLQEFRGKMKAALQKKSKKVPRYENGLAIVSIKPLSYSCEMTCIYVSCEDHLYQVGKCHVVTHNTALVQGTMLRDPDRIYLEVDLSKMIADLSDPNQMADRLKKLFDEVQQYSESEDQEIVLFMDEFHQVVQLSKAAVEALKPLLADSGTRGIRVIAATTYREFREHISPNQPLVERLQRITLDAPSKEMVVDILRGMAHRYGVDNQFVNSNIFEAIYEYTERYIPASAQPRKSILVLDSMVGWYRYKRRRLNMQLLADVIYESTGVNVAFRVDASKIEDELNKRVFAQEYATKMIAKRLQVCVADLNDKSKPMSSMLFCGSSGTGKQVFDDEWIPVYTSDGSVSLKRNGDLIVGDYVFNREGRPVEVTGVFPQGIQDIYEVELTDGRVLQVGNGHLWTYRSRFGNGARHWKTVDTVTLMEKNAKKYYGPHNSVAGVKFVIPMNQAVQWVERSYKLDPYVVGAFLGNGCLRDIPLGLSSADEFTVAKIAKLIGCTKYVKQKDSYTWNFYWTGSDNDKLMWCNMHRCDYYSTKAVFSELPDLVGKYSYEKYIPDCYKFGSVEQRWRLIQGLFDTDGHIGTNNRYNVSYSSSSKQLILDIQYVLYSLGISSSISDWGVREDRKDRGCSPEYHLHVKIGNPDKQKFFTLPRKLAIAKQAMFADDKKQRVKKFGEVIGIRDIRKTDRKGSMTCIMVDDPEHLYQAGDFIVTHNTEVTKQLAKILFDDERRLIRMDMSEYANEESLERFRAELTTMVWERPYSIVLLDEIEKACAPVTKLLLQVLDDARLTDVNNRVISFTNTYIILTTNAGSEIYKSISQYAEDDRGSGKAMKHYMKLIRESIETTTGANRFPPEFLGRLDAIVPFQPLSEGTLMNIVKRKLFSLMKEVKDVHGIEVCINNRVMSYIVKDNLSTDSNAGGARNAIAKIETDVVAPLAAFINANPDKRYLIVDVTGKMAFEDKNKLESDARIVVYPAAASVR